MKELEKRLLALEQAVETEADPFARKHDHGMDLPAAEWVRSLFPHYTPHAFAPHHLELLAWAEEIRPSSAPRPFIGIWPRGGAKSTLVELVVAMLLLRGVRKYALYVSESQSQADAHVQNVATLFEADAVSDHYPQHAERHVGKFGNVRGWRRDRIRTAGGATVDALGLDTAARGAKIDADRPDLIIFDDIDAELDTPRTTQKKLDLLTRSLLPAGTANCAVVGIQNLIHATGVFARLSDGRADFLQVRVLSGPIPAVYDLKTERRLDEKAGAYRDFIISGRPSWPEGQSLEACQQIINRIGLAAFQTECQHDVHEKPGALWNRRMLANCRISTAPMNEDGTPAMRRVAVAIDPSGGKVETGIIAVGLGFDGKGYVLRDATAAGADGPRAWATAAIELYYELSADVIVAEGNFGGDMVEATLRTVDPHVNVKLVTASRGKAVRAEPVASLYGSEQLAYGDSCVFHVGTFPKLEQELCGWSPGDPSPNRLDALVWAVTELMLKPQEMPPPSASTRPIQRLTSGFSGIGRTVHARELLETRRAGHL